VRTQYMLGGVTVVPGFEFAYQRLKTSDSATFSNGVAIYSSAVDINTDYYQFALSLSALYPVAPKFFLVASARTSLDFAHANLSGSSSFSIPDSATATASSSFTSNHTTAQAGVIYGMNSNFTVSLLGRVQYISKVPGMVFPIYNTANNTAIPLNGVTSVQVGDYQSLTSYGGSITAAIRF